MSRQVEIDEDGTTKRGVVSLALTPGLFANILAQAEVTSAAELSDAQICYLCRFVNSSIEATVYGRADPDSDILQRYIEVRDGQKTEIRSEDIGDEMMSLLMPAESDDINLLCDPQYSSVRSELYVGEATEDREDDVRIIGERVLRTTLQSPDLAY
jgi:hypothetical protein